MKKMNNKGFMLAETLIVSTFLITTLLFIYIQFNKVSKTYDTSFKYNTVDGMYATNNIVKYIRTDGLNPLKSALNSNNYVDITSCPSTYFTNRSYCLTLLNSLNVRSAIFTKENLNDVKEDPTGLNQSVIDFVNYINYPTADTKVFRLIVEFDDNTISTLKIK